MTDEYHTLVVGDSGQGKTTLLRELHDRSPPGGSSFWAGHRRADDAKVSGGDDVTVAAVSDPIASVEATRAAARQYAHRTGRPTQAIVDEAQAVMPEDADESNPLKQGLHEDRDVPIKWVLATQDPQDLPYTPLKQLRYIVWVGVPSPFHEGFARYFGLKDAGLPTERYEFVVFESGREAFEWYPVDRDSTKEKYG